MSKVIVHKPSHSLIIPHNQKVLDTIPKSKEFLFNGRKLVQIHHGEQEVLKLLEMGIDAPAPMLIYYKWPVIEGKYDPFPHQKEAACFHTLHKKSFNLSEPRTGKTHTLLMVYDYLKKIGKVDKLIIYTTLSTINDPWVKSVFDTYHQYTYSVVYGKEREAALNQDADIYITNHDGVKIVKDWVKSKKQINMVVWDEADVLCNSQTAMWKDFSASLRDDQRVILATGTPTGDGDPTAAWALAKIVSPDRVPKYFGSFKRLTMLQVSPFKWVPKREATALVHAALQPAICFRKKDVLHGIPDVHEHYVECGLSDEQTKMFRELQKEMETEYNSGKKLSAVNGADKLVKVLQVLLGAFKEENGDYHAIPCQPSIDAVLDCISKAKKKVIVFIPWRGAIEYYYKEIGKKYKSAMVNGTVGKTARDKIFKDFMHNPELKVLFAQQKTTSHGLEFSCADTMVWVGAPFSGRAFCQANERNNSIKQDSEMNTYYLYRSKVELSIYKALMGKKKVQSDVLNLYKQVIEAKAG